MRDTHFFILDGPDAVGKTTLAKFIGETMPTKYVHLTYIKDDRSMFRANYMALAYAQQWLSRGFNVVLDRGWMSENIYAGIYRGGSGLALDVRGLDRVIDRLCGIYVICAPSVESAVRRHAAMGDREMYKPSPQIAQIAQRYRDLYFGDPIGSVERPLLDDYVQHLIDQGGLIDRMNAHHYDIDVAGGDLLRVVEDISERSLTRMMYQYPGSFDRSRSNYVGHLAHAEFVFVGDRINPNKRGWWPFVDYGASSRAISKALHLISFDERRAVWTNANDPDEHLVDLLEMKPNLRVVALGGEATRHLENSGIPHISVYHPSFVNKFGRMAEYLQQLTPILS